MSIGLSPIAQPPGIETSPLPQGASSGPSMHTLARILRTISYSPTGLSITLESTHKSPFGFRLTLQPNWPSNWLKIVISERYGTPFMIDSPAANIAAAIIGKEAFLEPFILTAP